jgi:hypothetical protein
MRERLETSDIVAPRLWGTEKLTSKSSKFLAGALNAPANEEIKFRLVHLVGFGFGLVVKF